MPAAGPFAWGSNPYPRGGAALLPRLQTLVAEEDALLQEAAAFKGLDQGVVRVGTFSSVATHWLPRMVAAFRADHPGIDYELLLGDYAEIETWVRDGRVDFGFARLPAPDDLVFEETARDEFMAVLPAGHPLASAASFPVEAFEHEPFLQLASASNDEVADILDRAGLHIVPKLVTWDDYAIMSMVEQGLGLAILPRLVMRRIPYAVVGVSLRPAAYRRIGIIMRSHERLSLAASCFLEYRDLIGGDSLAGR